MSVGRDLLASGEGEIEAGAERQDLMDKLHLYIIGFGRPDLLYEQHRLINKYLKDPFEMTVVDNTPHPNDSLMRFTASNIGVNYIRSSSKNYEHPDALNCAAEDALYRAVKFYGFLDHDIFPRRETEIVSVLKKVGFYGIGQFHSPTKHKYLWPGFCFFSADWLKGRKLDFNGIRGIDKRDDGDCGSMNWPLFEEEDWQKLHLIDHGYGFLRGPDGYGIQSFGYEHVGDWLHLSNASDWMEIPEPGERRRLAAELIARL